MIKYVGLSSDVLPISEYFGFFPSEYVHRKNGWPDIRVAFSDGDMYVLINDVSGIALYKMLGAEMAKYCTICNSLDKGRVLLNFREGKIIKDLVLVWRMKHNLPL